MLNDISTFLGNPLNQALVSIPLSVVGNFTSDAIKSFWESVRQKNQVHELEELLFSSFIFAISIHGKFYDESAQKERRTIRDVIVSRRENFLNFMRYYGDNLPFLPSALNDDQIQKNFASALIEVFGDFFPENQRTMIETVIKDVSRLYRDAFFQKVSKDQQLWIAFNQSLKIDSIIDLICQLQENIPTRSQFESIRKYILEREGTPENIDVLRRNYLAYLLRLFSLLELKGFSPRVGGVDVSFKLTEIFIPFHLAKNDKNGATLAQLDFSDYYKLFPENDALRYDKAKLLSSIEKSPRMVILGDPGSGKSTLLKYIAVQICTFQESKNLLPYYVPIFLKVSDYAKSLKSNHKTRLIEYLYGEYDKQFAGLFKWAFENRRALLLLDGLDEVLDTAQRIKVVDELNDLVARMPENRYIVTSRIVGYNDAKLGLNFDQLLIQPFNRAQIEGFCDTWYTAVAKYSERDIKSALVDSKSLYNSIVQKPEVEKLASNPLLVTLIASIHFKGQSLPYNRVELYDIATETLLQYWVHGRVFEESQIKDEDLLVGVLSPIAFYIHQTNPEGVIEETVFESRCYELLVGADFGYTAKDARNEIREIKKFLREQAGFFHEKGFDDAAKTRLFGFLHQTFQEYLAAIELVNLWKEDKLDFSEFILNPRWTEVLRLAAGILKSEKGRAGKRGATKYVEEILECHKQNPTANADGILLVSYILSDNIEVSSQTQDLFFDEYYFDAWTQVANKDANEVFVKSFSLLLRSKFKEYVWEKAKKILSEVTPDLQWRFSTILGDNRKSISDASLFFRRFLCSSDEKIADPYWAYLKAYISNQSQSIEWDINNYYSTHNYGDPNFEYYYPVPDIETLVSLSDFLEILEKIECGYFVKYFDLFRSLVGDYVYIYSSSPHGPSWHEYNSLEDIANQLLAPQPLRMRIALYNIIISQSPSNQINGLVEGIQRDIDLLESEERNCLLEIWSPQP